MDQINARVAEWCLCESATGRIPVFNGRKHAGHKVTLHEVLGLANVRGHVPPQLHMVGAQPADLSVGVDLSPTITAMLPQILMRAEDILREWDLLN